MIDNMPILIGLIIVAIAICELARVIDWLRVYLKQIARVLQKASEE